MSQLNLSIENIPIEVSEFYNSLLNNVPQLRTAFPELRALKGGGSIYFYKQRAAMLGVLKKKGLYIEFESAYINDLTEFGMEYTARKIKKKNSDGTVSEEVIAYRFFISDMFAEVIPFYHLLESIADDKYYGSNVEHFACCNDFIRCSDAKECTHGDAWEYVGCEYRKNLKNGRIFYGNNKNI